MVSNNKQDSVLPIRLKLATLNTWLLPETLSHTQNFKIRVRELTEVIRKCDFDILALQEVWAPGVHKQTLLNPDNFTTNLKYLHCFRSGPIGSGLVTYSKYPITGIQFYKYSMCGNPFRIRQPDWHMNKGIGLCYISSPVGVISVYNTHLVADYDDYNFAYQEHRVVEAFELVRFINQTKKGHVILLGDLNIHSDSLEYQIITKFGGFKDSWANEDEAFTFNTLDNPYYTTKMPIERLDYIMLPAHNDDIRILDKYFVFRETSVQSVWYSDHFGLKVEVEVGHAHEYPVVEDLDVNTLSQAKNILEKYIKKRSIFTTFKSGHFFYSSLTTLALLLPLISIAYFICSLLFSIEWMLPYFLLVLILLLLIFISFFFLFLFFLFSTNEWHRLRLEIVRIEMLLQSLRT